MRDVIHNNYVNIILIYQKLKDTLKSIDGKLVCEIKWTCHLILYIIKIYSTPFN